MTIVNFTPAPALVGGVLIGLSAGLVLFLNGKIAGVSGIVARTLRGVPGDTAWRALFLAGLVLGAAATFGLWPASAGFEVEGGLARTVCAGLLVGFGTRLGGGCTSGHGVCGLARGSLAALAATLTFMLAGFAVVYVMRHVLAGGAA